MSIHHYKIKIYSFDYCALNIKFFSCTIMKEWNLFWRINQRFICFAGGCEMFGFSENKWDGV